MDGLDGAAAHDRIRMLLDGKVSGDAAYADGITVAIVDALTSEGWDLTRAPEPPLKRIVVTMLPGGQAIETLGLVPHVESEAG